MSLCGTIVGATEPGGPTVVGFDLDASRQAFLADHLVGGRPLLSTVMGIEAMGRAASLVAGGKAVAGVRDVRVHPPLLLPASGLSRATVTVREELAGLRCAVTGPDGACHFEAVVVVGAWAGVPEQPPLDPPVPGGLAPVLAEDIYRVYFHGPSFRVIGRAFSAANEMVGVAADSLPPIWHSPEASATAPLLVELCLQTAGLAELAATGRMMIPDRIDLIERFGDLDDGSGIPLRAVVTRRQPGNGFDAVVVDDAGRVQLRVKGYRTVAFAHPPDVSTLAPLVAALQP